MNKTDGNSNQQQDNFNQNSERPAIDWLNRRNGHRKEHRDKVMNFLNFSCKFLNPNYFFQFSQ